MLCDLVEVEAGPGTSPKSLKCFYIVFTFHKQDCPWLLLPCSSCAPKMEFSLGINIDYLSPYSISFCSSSLPHLSLLCICTMDASSLGPFACITVQRKSIHIIQQEQIHFRKHKTLIFSPLHCAHADTHSAVQLISSRFSLMTLCSVLRFMECVRRTPRNLSLCFYNWVQGKCQKCTSDSILYHNLTFFILKENICMLVPFKWFLLSKLSITIKVSTRNCTFKMY